MVGATVDASGAVSGLAFSENGYYLATGSADATVRLWDLRKLKNFQTITPSAGAAVGAVGFDFSGQFLAVGAGPSLTVYETKSWGTVAELAALAAPVSGVGFASGATFAGAFADGKFEGEGVYTWADGATYTGGWSDNKMHGQGTYTDKDGQQWSGPFFNGKLKDGESSIVLRDTT